MNKTKRSSAVCSIRSLNGLTVRNQFQFVVELIEWNNFTINWIEMERYNETHLKNFMHSIEQYTPKL